MAETTALTLSESLESKVASIGAEGLPANFNAVKWQLNCLAFIRENRNNFSNFSVPQIVEGLMKGAYLGLDFWNKECYLIPYGNQLQFMADWRGSIKLAKRYSTRPIKQINAKVVREGDDFQMTSESGQDSFTFKPLPFNNGKIVGAFAYVQYEDGGVEVETLNVAELDSARSQSKAQNSPAWKKFGSEMYRKVAIHRLCKHIPIDFELPNQQSLLMEGIDTVTTAKEQALADAEYQANAIDVEVEDF